MRILTKNPSGITVKDLNLIKISNDKDVWPEGFQQIGFQQIGTDKYITMIISEIKLIGQKNSNVDYYQFDENIDTRRYSVESLVLLMSEEG